jgi:hypothetical protein
MTDGQKSKNARRQHGPRFFFGGRFQAEESVGSIGRWKLGQTTSQAGQSVPALGRMVNSSTVASSGAEMA